MVGTQTATQPFPPRKKNALVEYGSPHPHHSFYSRNMPLLQWRSRVSLYPLLCFASYFLDRARRYSPLSQYFTPVLKLRLRRNNIPLHLRPRLIRARMPQRFSLIEMNPQIILHPILPQQLTRYVDSGESRAGIHRCFSLRVSYRQPEPAENRIAKNQTYHLASLGQPTFPIKYFNKNHGASRLVSKSPPATKGYGRGESKQNSRNLKKPLRSALINRNVSERRLPVKGVSGQRRAPGGKQTTTALPLIASCAPTPHGYVIVLHNKVICCIRPPPVRSG